MVQKTILSIDGGGIRGIIPLVVLQAIEEELSGQYIADYIDVITGTSTGALISSALCVGDQGDPMYAAEILEIYKNRGKQMFVENVSGQTTVYKSLPLTRLIDQNFGQLKLKDLKKHYFFPLLSIASKEPFIITSFDDHKKFYSNSLANVLKAASAVPDFFDPVHFEDELLADGVVYAKNPSALAVQSFLNYFQEEKDLLLLSFGTGHLEGCHDEIENSAIESHHQVKNLFRRLPQAQYFRIQPEVKKASQAMDDASDQNIEKLIADAQQYVDENQNLIKEIAGQFL